MSPLPFLAAGYVSGLLADALPADLPLGGATLAAALLLGLAAAARVARSAGGLRNRSSARALGLMALGAAGALAVPALHGWALPTAHLLRSLPRERANLIGHISRPIERLSGRRPRIRIAAERLVIRGVAVPAEGTVQITLAGPLLTELEIGDRILLRRVRLFPPRRHLNPGGFDYREFLRLRGVHAEGYASPRALERLVPRERAAWRRGLFAFRDRMRNHLQGAAPPDAAGLLEAMTLGIREDLSRPIRDSFRRAGVAHLLAISGLHVGFIALSFYFLLHALIRRLPPGAFPLRPFVWTPAKAASLATVLLIVLFTFLTGARISTIRAAVMVVAYLLARILEHPRGALHSVFLAALIILITEPGFLWDTGFQLTFVAVTAILLALRRLVRPAYPPLFRAGAWWRDKFLQFAGLQGVIFLAVVPLTALHFHEAHPVGLVTNFFLIPAASLAVPLTFLVAALGATLSFAGAGAAWLLAPADALLALLAQFMIFTARAAAAVPGGTFKIAPPGVLLIACFLAALVAALGGRRAALRRGGWLAIPVLLGLILWPGPLPAPPGTGRATLLLPDAGGRDAFFLRLPDGRGVAFDAGGRRGGDYQWRNVLGPLLRHRGEGGWDTLLSLAASPAASPAARELAGALGLKTVVSLRGAGGGASGRIGGASGRIGGASGVVSSAPDGIEVVRPARAHREWETGGGGARLRLLKFEEGPSALELTLEIGGEKARWLLVAGRKRRGARRWPVPEGRYNLVRLPEGMLREARVLDWLERTRPAAVFAAPGYAPRLPLAAWRRVRARQRALGVYRPERGGMVRITTAAGPARMERFRAAAPWPGARRGGWVAFRRTAAPAQKADRDAP